MPRTLSLIVLILLVSRTASGHEFWIEPHAYTVASGDILRIGLFHGERFLGDAVPRDEAMIDSFTLLGPDGEQTVAGRAGATTSFAKPAVDGVHVIAYRTRRYANDLDAADFEAYLREEGLHWIAKRRAELGETTAPGSEVYSRCAKSIVRVGDVDTPAVDHVFDWPLEIVLDDPPYDVAPGSSLSARVLSGGEPLAGARVVAVSRIQPDRLVELTSDDEGRVSFEADDAGAWMLTTIHMVRTDDEADADWESFWASVTFEVTHTE